MKKSRQPAPQPSPQISKYLPQLQVLSLVIVFVLAIIIRFTQLTQIPSTLNRDEAALAYNAYLLMKTGRDEWNRSWPVSLESFGDYKLPGYPFLLLGSFRLFGVNDFAVRFPSAVAGVLLVGVAYLFCRTVLSFKHWNATAVAASLYFLLAHGLGSKRWAAVLCDGSNPTARPLQASQKQAGH
jgi:4-amino-4-deoxy-L-arabinose transferase-like glycosyltransferase